MAGNKKAAFATFIQTGKRTYSVTLFFNSSAPVLVLSQPFSAPDLGGVPAFFTDLFGLIPPLLGAFFGLVPGFLRAFAHLAADAVLLAFGGVFRLQLLLFALVLGLMQLLFSGVGVGIRRRATVSSVACVVAAKPEPQPE